MRKIYHNLVVGEGESCIGVRVKECPGIECENGLWALVVPVESEVAVVGLAVAWRLDHSALTGDLSDNECQADN